ncbi:phage tail tape measure protein [uncultured Prevotella sp.]|uniref:phage tail tape measure protein n=1 Tax=uncultured Prevotella sp. TaxID=159272 RepID=UPI0027E23D9A|nr:phage tail tape measure protein [uncultured Prevotella sp.]
MAKTYSRTVKVYLDGAQIDNSVPAIQKKIRELTRDVKKMTIGTEEYNKTVKSISELNSILAEHKRAIRGVAEENKSLGQRLSSVADFFNKWYYSLQTGLDALGGVTTTIRQCVKDFADMEEAMADVRKYTGQTAEQVHEMNEDFKRMDTRTSREQLNALAGAAGRLGITNQKMIEEFVDGADKINVALGDDLGEGAVDKIGKLAHMFGEDENKGLRGAMLATGSAVNDLAQSSSANAGYIVDFTADLSGVAIQAGMTQAQIMGLASALDQNMQEEATASTVFSQLITKMYQEPARFATLAGEDVKEFTELLKTNANEALLKFLSAMQSTGGFDKMAPLFSEMKLEGTRAVGVLSSVATHLDQVREAQKVAFNAYNEGNSVIEEFNVQNNTVQAGIDKAKKQFLDLSVELGEKLLPLIQKGISTGSMAVKILSTITNFVIAHRKALITLSTTIGAYVAGVKLSVLWKQRAIATEKLSAFWHAIQDKWLMTIMLRHAVLNGTMSKTVALQKMLNVVIGANPFGVFIAAITAVTTALVLYRQKLDDTAIAQNKLSEIRQEAASKVGEQETKIRALIEAAKDESMSMDDRRKAVAQLNKIIPGYNAQLDETTRKYKANDEALKDYLVSLQRKYELEGAKDELRRLGGEIAKERVKLRKAQDDFDKAKGRYNKVNNQTAYMPSTWQAGVGIATSTSNEVKAVEESNEKLRKLMAEREGIVKVYGGDLKADAVKGSKTKETPGSGNKPGHYVSAEDKAANKAKIEAEKKVQKDLDAITSEYETKRTKAKEDYLKGDIATQEEYNRKIEDLQLEELNKKLEVAGIEPKKRAEIEKNILDYKVKLYDQLREIEQSFGDTEAEQLAHELDTIKQKYDQDLALLNNLHDKKLISEEQYQADLKKLKERFTADTDKANKESASRVISDAKATFDDLMESQRKANIKAGNIDEQSQSDRTEAWKGYLQKILDDTSLNGEQRLAVQQAIEDADIDLTEDSLKQKQDLTQKYNDILCNVIVQAGQQLGEQLGKVLMDEKANFKDFLRGILTLMIDALEKTVLAARAASIAKNVSTLGFAGLAKAAVETALITAAFEMAKAAVGSFDTGGFTPAGPWDKPQGVVHSNEFVANRFATANPNVLPVLNLIDEAQRSGSVSRLSPDDIAAVIPTTQRQFASGAMASGGRSSAGGVAQGAMQAAPQDAAITAVLSRVVRSLNTLDRRFSTPIIAETYATGKHGTIEAERLVNKMKSNVSRKR